MGVCIKLIIADTKPKTMLLPLDNCSNLDMMLDEIAKSTKISFIKENVTIKQYNKKFDEYIDIDPPYTEILVKDGMKYEVYVMLDCEKEQETQSKSQVLIETKIVDDDVDNKLIISTTSISQSMNSEENNASNIKENNDIDNKGNDTKEVEIKEINQISKSNEEQKAIKNENQDSDKTNQEIVNQQPNTTEIVKESDTHTSKISSSNDTSTSLKAYKLHERVTVEKLEKILPEPIVPELKHTINCDKTKVAYAENPYFKDANTIETTQARGYIESTAHREIHYGDTPHDETLTRSNVTQYTAMLGDLYDATRDKFIGMNIFSSKNLPNDAYQTFENHSVDSEYVISNKLSDKLNLLKIDGELSLSILSGIASITGSAGYLNEKRHTHNSVQCNFIYKKRTIHERLHITSDVLRPCFCPSISDQGTHVVIGISYGANATISLTYEYSKETSKTDLFGMIGIGTDKHKEKDAKTDDVSIVTDIFDRMKNIFGGGSISAQKLDTSGLDEKKMRLKVFADIEANVDATPNTIQEAMEFIRNVPTFITGKGKQIEFILFPLSILQKQQSLQIKVDRLYCHIQADTIKHIEHIFDQIEESHQKLNEIEAMIRKYQAFISKTEKERIREFRFNFDTSVSKFREELGQLVQKVRSGKPIDQLNAIRKVFEDDPNIGSKQIEKFEESCEPLKEKFALLEEFGTYGVVLITTYSDLFKAKNKAIGQELYLLFFSFNDDQRDPKWGNVVRYFLQRCGEIEDLQNNPTDKDLNEIFMAIDIDIIPGIMKKEGLNDGLRICLIIDGEYVDEDVYANDYELIMNKPTVHCNSKMLINDEVKDQKSLCLACPKSFGGRCDKKEIAWYCSRCRQEILYGFDEHFYCECGHQAVNSYGFKCGSKMHGIKYVPFDKGVLSKLLSKMKLEPTSSKILFPNSNQKDYVIMMYSDKGIGKTTFINAFYHHVNSNYLSFQEALMKRPQFLIPGRFNMNKLSIEINHNHSLSSFGSYSTTVSHQKYHIKVGEKNFHFIDTPGIDKLDNEANEKYFNDIFESYKKIDFICYCLFPNITRKTSAFENSLTLLNKLQEKTSAKTIFCFTQSKIVNFQNSGTYEILKDHIATHNLPIVLEDNVFYFENETYLYFWAKFRDVKLENIKQDDIEHYWSSSNKSLRKMVEYIKNG